MNASAPLIQLRGLTKRFRIAVKSPGLLGATRHLFRPHHEEKLAVDRLDLEILAGESVGYVGPNGAGKSGRTKRQFPWSLGTVCAVGWNS